MQKVNLNQSIKQCLRGQISTKELLNSILIDIHCNKALYGLHKLNEDELSDFILFVYPQLFNALSSYKPNTKALFSTYIQATIRYTLKRWNQIKNQKRITSTLLNSYYGDSLTNETLEENEPLYGTKTITQRGDIHKILVLALYNSHHLSPRLIKKLAKATQYPEEKIWEMKEFVDKESFNQHRKNQKRLESLHQSYFYKIYTQEKIKHNQEFSYTDKKNLDFHTQVWKNKIEKFEHNRNTSKIQAIAKVLKISYSTINNILHRVRQSGDIFFDFYQ
ncbi:MAG: hypothetical protein E7062_09065 [Spirochaetaceae bacterium]|nr:hypothetical protein [Spirochaetaceae bacterium]